MKNLILLFISFICLSVIIIPQSHKCRIEDPLVKIQQQDSIRQIRWKQPVRKEVYRAWEKHLIKKNNTNNKSSSVLYRPDKIICDDTVRYSYSYDNSGNCLTETLENLVNHSWVNSWEMTYTYDNSGNCLTQLYQEWLNNAWANISRSTRSYNSSGKLLLQLDENWAITAWVNFDRYTYNYNSSGKGLIAFAETD